MKPKIIHQFVAGFKERDAISNEAKLLRAVFRSWGCKSEILCDGRNISKFVKNDAYDYGQFTNELSADDIAILHLSIGCKMNLEFAKLNCRKVILYHNITPDFYFRCINPIVADDLALGRKHLAQLAGVADVNLADSAYNAGELIEAGYKNATVFPFAVDINSFNNDQNNKIAKADLASVKHLHNGRKNILFVGRQAPNKRIEDILTVMFFMSKIDKKIQFVHAGASDGNYSALINAHANILGIRNVVFLDSVPQAVLNECYKTADAFLCLSQHEGFCVPIVEAMLHHIPIFSLATSAVPETLGGSGVLFSAPPNHLEIAETIAHVLHDDNLRKAIIAKQDQRVEAFRTRNIDAELRTLLASIL